MTVCLSGTRETVCTKDQSMVPKSDTLSWKIVSHTKSKHKFDSVQDSLTYAKNMGEGKFDFSCIHFTASSASLALDGHFPSALNISSAASGEDT